MNLHPDPDSPGPTPMSWFLAIHLTGEECAALRELLDATLDHLGVVDCDEPEDIRRMTVLEGVRMRLF